MIPENINTIPQVASWHFKGEGGFLDWNSVRVGVTHFGIPRASSEFPEREDGKLRGCVVPSS